jgi:hypothetical protein
MRIKGIAAGLFLAVSFALPGVAQESCLVEEAAQAALQREIELIKATATDVESTFNGPNGCINTDIFNDFDLSVAIPDLAGMLSSATTNLITDAINNARSQVCQAINDQVEGVVGNARGTVSDFNSGSLTNCAESWTTVGI